MKLILFNTRTRSKELFAPLDGETVRLYSCGPTVYARAHLGNLRTYLFVDTLRRTLFFLGWKVRHAMNVTDVGHTTVETGDGEDKMVEAALKERRSVRDIADEYTDAFFADLKALNILKPTIILKATEHIPGQIALIQKLEERGLTYRTNDGIYFDTKKFPAYANFAHLDLKGLRTGARVAENPEKRNVTDFALWKFSPAGVQREMEWPSPWGVGFPGWHIECSAMAMKALGEQFDVHTGGTDHVPIHHTNEIAQSEAATGKSPFVNFWLHGAFLTMGEQRMGKSEGNALTLDDLRNRGFAPSAFRFYVLLMHYRQTAQFSWQGVAAAEEGLERIRQFLRRLQAIGNGKLNEAVQKRIDALRKAFLAAVTNDLSTPEAIAALFSFVKDLNALLDAGTTAIPARTILKTLLNFDEILGLNLKATLGERVPKDIRELAERRAEARAKGNFKEADEIRSVSAQKGFLIEDTPQGQRIRPK